MKLWLVRKKNGLINSPWRGVYDCTNGLVIRATNERAARAIAAESHGDEGAQAWTDASLSTCEPLTASGESELILRDFHAG